MPSIHELKEKVIDKIYISQLTKIWQKAGKYCTGMSITVQYIIQKTSEVSIFFDLSISDVNKNYYLE